MFDLLNRYNKQGCLKFTINDNLNRECEKAQIPDDCCGVFLVENLSVILQRFYYKAGKRKGVKQRLFKRTPIHDHFRTSMSLIEPGCTVKFTTPTKLFHESKITVRFWIVTIVLAAITIITLKIR